jgi:hypothetical protein
MLTTIERLEQTEKDLKTVLEKFAVLEESNIVAGVENAQQLAELAAQRMLGVEQSAAALAKTLTGLTKALINKAVVTGEDIMGHIQKIDDDGDRDKINGLIQIKAIAKTDSVGPEDLVVTAQNYINTADPTKSKSVREYSLIELPLPTINQQLKKDLVGRKVGDTIHAGSNDKGVYVLTIREIYRILLPPTGEKTGESTTSEPNTQETPPAADAQAANSEGETSNGQQTQ